MQLNTDIRMGYLISRYADQKHADGSLRMQCDSFSAVVTEAERELEGDFLGLTMIPEEGQSVTYGMRAMLPHTQTAGHPIVQVVSNLGGEKAVYNVDISRINPDNATQLEMFALLSYTDKMGVTDGGSFGSHQQMEVYARNASHNGYCGSLSGGDVFLKEKFNWSAILNRMMRDYKSAGIDSQYEDCEKLVDFFDGEDHMAFLKQKMDEMRIKIKNGDTEPVYQIGGQAYTEKEWEELLARFDSAEEDMREEAGRLLTEESTSCTYPDEDSGQDVHYITWYTEEGIFCRRAGQTNGYIWSIPLDNREQYDRVTEFINHFSSDWNMRFTAHENFWRDFLNDGIDMGGFMCFVKGTDKGVPKGSPAGADSVYDDGDEARWVQYFNSVLTE